jgi:HAD superfamily hydrolase (TIGR01509 family)
MIDWKSIDTVLLDMDGTLLDLEFDNFFWNQHLPKVYAETHKLSEADAQLQMNTKFNIGRGTLNWYCLDHWSQQFQLDIPSLKREQSHRVALRPLTVEFLQQLKKSPVNVVMVTNAHPETLAIKMEKIDITMWFDRIVVSHDLNAAKEEQEFWHKLQQLNPFDPARTLLIDDTEAVLDSAKRYGIAHLITLLQPDSQQPNRLETTYPAIHHFDEIMHGETP